MVYYGHLCRRSDRASDGTWGIGPHGQKMVKELRALVGDSGGGLCD